MQTTSCYFSFFFLMAQHPFKLSRLLGIVVHTIKFRTWEAEAEKSSSDFEASLCYIVNFRLASGHAYKKTFFLSETEYHCVVLAGQNLLNSKMHSIHNP